MLQNQSISEFAINEFEMGVISLDTPSHVIVLSDRKTTNVVQYRKNKTVVLEKRN
jgi:hypothetical protein